MEKKFIMEVWELIKFWNNINDDEIESLVYYPKSITISKKMDDKEEDNDETEEDVGESEEEFVEIEEEITEIEEDIIEMEDKKVDLFCNLIVKDIVNY